MSFSKSTIFAFTIVLAGLNFAASADEGFPVQAPIERFTRLLDRIDEQLSRLSKQESFDSKIQYLDNEGLREPLQSLEDLANLYSHHGKDKGLFAEIFEKSKEFEDHISRYRDSRSYAMSADHSKAGDKFDVALKADFDGYSKFIAESDWFKRDASLSTRFRGELLKEKWRSLPADRDFILSRLVGYFKHLQKKEDYDFTSPERGFHELRRDVRRMTYFNRAIDNLVVTSNDGKCPLGEAPAPVAAPAVKSYSCKISQCLMSRLDQVDSDASSLRQEGMRDVLQDHAVNEDISNRAKKVLSDLKASNAYLHIIAQLRSCMTKDEKKNE